MADLLTKCYNCSAELILRDGEELCRCGYCRVYNARPKSTGATLDVLKRANQLRLDCDFVNAEASYRRVLDEHPDEHEALWGLVQCRYGVEYVRDVRLGRSMPVCHSVRVKPMQLDPNFRRACELAPADVRKHYETDAEYIDNAQARIRDLQRDGERCDVFLCYKETDPDTGDRTQDSQDAERIYRLLTREGYTVFYAPESLRRKVGEDYEAAIYHAIETSTVMLVIGTRPEHLTATWVASEWSRFLERIDNGERKYLFPLYRGMRATDLPREFQLRHLQGLDMGDWEFLDALKEALGKCVGRAKDEQQPAAATVVESRTPETQKSDVRLAQEKYLAQLPGYSEEAHRAWREKYAMWPEADENLFQVIQNEEGGVTIDNYIGTSLEVVRIPETIGGRPVTRINSAKGTGFLWSVMTRSFANHMEIKKIIFPYGLRSIGSYVFARSNNIESIAIPQTVADMGIFVGQNAKEIELQEGLKRIQKEAFAGCKAKEIHLPSSLEFIGKEAFRNSELESIIIPENVLEIEGGAFENSRELKSITLMNPKTAIKKEYDSQKTFPYWVLIRGKKGSSAEAWAKASNSKFEEI